MVPAPIPVVAQAQASDSAGTLRRVDGRVVLGSREGQKPVRDQWVILHRVGPDRAGPLDSVRTTPLGQFSFRYRATGDTAALYIVSTQYGGVSYFAPPLRSPVVRGDDASITVFDTTSGPVAIKLGGRHIVIGMPQASGRRPIGEVYDLVNDSTVTLIARDSITPVWSAHLPPGAVGFQLNTSGDLANGAVSRNGSSVGLFAPLSPGIRQLAFTYELPSDAFPLSIPVERPTTVIEVLVQEPTATVQGAAMREVPPQTTEGRTFRRLLGQDVPGSAVLRIDVPHLIGGDRQRVYAAIAITMLVAMAVALVVAARRSAPQFAFVATPRDESRSQAALRAIAALDMEFERVPAPDAAVRAAYDARRTVLKLELAEALAAERGPG